jgi:D-cysteine desulfhydrase/L-cysteate sulfo-lyase
MLKIPFDSSKVIIEDRFIGPGYPIPSPEGNNAALAFASQEGILFDKVYTGKAAAGLFQYAKEGKFSQKDNILFIHTGGNSGLYY